MSKSDESSPPEQGTVYYGANAITRLRDLHKTLTPKLFLDAIEYGVGFGHQSAVTEPLTSEGWIRWAKIVGHLRAALIKLGWTQFDRGTLALVISPDRTLAIVVSSTDKNTGIDEEDIPQPKSKNRKGVSVVGAVADKAKQLPVWHGEEGFEQFDEADEEDDSWGALYAFIYHVDPKTGAVRSELSLPIEIDNDHLSGYIERIFLPEIEPKDALPMRDATDEDEPIDVPVKRKAQ